MELLLILVYVAGSIPALRRLILNVEDKMQRAKDETSGYRSNGGEYRGETQWYGLPATFFRVLFGTLLWPAVGVLMLYWWLAFPRGRKTAFQREQEAKERNEKLQAELKAAQQQLAEWRPGSILVPDQTIDQPGLEWLPGSSPRELAAAPRATLADIEDLLGRAMEQVEKGLKPPPKITWR